MARKATPVPTSTSAYSAESLGVENASGQRMRSYRMVDFGAPLADGRCLDDSQGKQ